MKLLHPYHKRFGFLVLVLLFLITATNAQVKGKVNKDNDFKTYWEVGIKLGSPVFMGDIKRYRYVPAYDEWRAGAGFSFSRRFSPLLSLQANYLLGQLAGSRKIENFYFESNFHELSLRMMIHLNQLAGLKNHQPLISANVLLGTGMTFYESELFMRKSPNTFEHKWQKKGRNTPGRH